VAANRDAIAAVPLADVVAEGDRVMSAAVKHGVVLRLMGGLAVFSHSPAMPAVLVRTYGDIDLATVRKQSRAVGDLLVALGYEPARQFNALQGDRRMLFHDRRNERKLDVFVGGFELNHVIPITDRIEADPRTIPLAELLLTKFQIVEFTDKDLRDTVALLRRHELGDHDTDTINADVVAALWSRIEASPKSRSWRLRARVGERKRSYEVPDEA
jgi:hypothetical protein